MMIHTWTKISTQLVLIDQYADHSIILFALFPLKGWMP